MGHNIDGTEVNEKALSEFKEKIKLEDIEFVQVYKPLNEKNQRPNWIDRRTTA